MAFGIVVPAGAHPISGGAIAELVDVEGVFLIWVEALDLGDHFHGITCLCEMNYSLALVAGGGMHHGNGMGCGRPFGLLMTVLSLSGGAVGGQPEEGGQHRDGKEDSLLHNIMGPGFW
jgi:hypothetical protein